MSRKTQHRDTYENRVIDDALNRLITSGVAPDAPLSSDELKSLARRHREAFYGADRKKERLQAYEAHLAKTYGADLVSRVSDELTRINNAIGFEEK